MGLWVFPCGGFLFPSREGPNDRRAALGLGNDHLRQCPLGLEPSPPPHFRKDLPHADETRPAASWINNVSRESPSQLLRDLDSHRLLAFDAIRLAQCRDVEVSALGSKRARRIASKARRRW